MPEIVPEIVMVRSFEIRKTRNQDSFGALRLSRGKAGNFADVDGKIWGLNGLLGKGQPAPAAGDLLEVRYKAEDYQGKPQWIIQSWRRLEGNERDGALADFTPPVRIDGAFYRQRLEELIEKTSPERVSGMILREIFDRPSFREAFYQAPAARDFHQNYPGGLLEHTINVTSVALCIADAYAIPGCSGLTFNQHCLSIDRQVLISAGLLHDIGKMDTYILNPLSECTDLNSWEGHLALSYAAVRRAADPYLNTPPYPEAVDEMHKLLNCILAHHGSLEFGSPVVPACAEAFLLAQADMTDARLADIVSGAGEAFGRDPKTRWLRNTYHFKNGIFIGDWEAGRGGK